MMKRGTILKCINADGAAYLILNHLYVVPEDSRGLWVRIRPGTPGTSEYLKERFVIIVEP